MHSGELQNWIERLIRENAALERVMNRQTEQLTAKDAEIARLKETAVITGIDPEQYKRSVYRGTRYKEAFRKLGGHMQAPDFWDSIYEKIGLPPAKKGKGEGDE